MIKKAKNERKNRHPIKISETAHLSLKIVLEKLVSRVANKHSFSNKNQMLQATNFGPTSLDRGRQESFLMEKYYYMMAVSSRFTICFSASGCMNWYL